MPSQPLQRCNNDYEFIILCGVLIFVIGETPAVASKIDLGLGDNRLAGMVELVANQKQFGGY